MVRGGNGERRGMLPEDLYRIRWAGDAQIDPSGRRVAFVVTTLSEAEDDYRSGIYVVDADGADHGEPRRMTRGERRDTNPRWSPDGGSLAFLSDRDGDKPQVYII